MLVAQRYTIYTSLFSDHDFFFFRDFVASLCSFANVHKPPSSWGKLLSLVDRPNYFGAKKCVHFHFRPSGALQLPVPEWPWLWMCTRQTVYPRALKLHNWLQGKKIKNVISFHNISNVLLFTSCFPDFLFLHSRVLWDTAQGTIGAYLLTWTVYWASGPPAAHCLLSA